MKSSDAKRRREGRFASLDIRIAALAAGQKGLVRLEQLLALGLNGSGVRSRVARGRLHRVHRGVYAVGHPLVSREGEWLAAVFAAGEGAVLSHHSAATLHGIRTDTATIHVSVPRPGGRRQDGFRVHRVEPFHPADYGRMHDIPCTSLPRALIDIAPAIGRRGVELAIAEAQHLKVYDRAAVEAAVTRARGRRGVGIVRTALGLDGVGSTLTRSELEERFLALSRRAGFPLPAVNCWIPLDDGGYSCDFVWFDARLIVETDGRDAHTRELQFEQDRRRDARLKLAGWEVVRFTWLQVTEQPGWVVSTVGRFRELRLTAAAGAGPAVGPAPPAAAPSDAKRC